MYELLNQVIQQKNLEEKKKRVDYSVNNTINETSSNFIDYEEDVYDEDVYGIVIIFEGGEYESTDMYTLDEFEEESFENIFSDQMDLLPEEVLNKLKYLPNMLYDLKDSEIIYNLDECS